jgi:hypothetical protein
MSIGQSTSELALTPPFSCVISQTATHFAIRAIYPSNPPIHHPCAYDQRVNTLGRPDRIHLFRVAPTSKGLPRQIPQRPFHSYVLSLPSLI